MILEGDHIFLRKVKASDTDHILTWENDPEIWEVSDNRTKYTREEIQEFVLSKHDLDRNKQLRLMICLHDGRAIGCLDLYEYDSFHKRAGIGILVYEQEHRQKGFGQEALELLIGFCKKKMKMKQLFCHVLEGNDASIRLFKKNGFTTTGTKLAWRKYRGRWTDEYLMQLLLN